MRLIIVINKKIMRLITVINIAIMINVGPAIQLSLLSIPPVCFSPRLSFTSLLSNFELRIISDEELAANRVLKPMISPLTSLSQDVLRSDIGLFSTGVVMTANAKQFITNSNRKLIITRNRRQTRFGEEHRTVCLTIRGTRGFNVAGAQRTAFP